VESFGTNQNHDQTVAPPMDRGKPVTANLFIFLRFAAEDAPSAAQKDVFKVL